MLSLLQLQRTLGEVLASGAVPMASLSHKVIAQQVDTSREIVSAQMSLLRRLGMIRYSRKYIDVDCEALEQALLNGGPALQPRWAMYALTRPPAPPRRRGSTGLGPQFRDAQQL
jgi:hypothetical protein